MAEHAQVQYRQILLPTDGSPQSLAAARHAIYLAGQLGSALTALYAIESDYRLGVHLGEEMHEMRDAARQALSEVESMASGTGVAVTARFSEGKIAESIVEAAKEIDADLIVMGTHGMGAIERMLLGSTSTEVAQRAPCPVLLVR